MRRYALRDRARREARHGRLSAARQALANTKRVDDAVEARNRRGLATVVEVAQARREAAEADFKLQSVIGTEQSAYAELINAMGVAPNVRIAVADNADEPLPAAPQQDVDQMIRSTLADRPDFVAAIGKVMAAEAELRGAEAAWSPTIGLEAQVYQNLGAVSSDGSPYSAIDRPGGQLLLRLSWPLYDGHARDANVGIVRSKVAEAQDALAAARDEAGREVTDAYTGMRTSFAEYTAALVLTQAAQSAYDAALDAYRHGVGTYTALANDETALVRAQSERTDAHANVFTAAAALAFSTGSQPHFLE